MKKHILITRPLHDIPTSYLHFISGELKQEINSVGEYTVVDLERENAVREKFEKAIDSMNPRLIILHGHGTYDSIAGQNYEIILDKENVAKLESKIIYAVVCDSSQELGDFAIEKGKAEAYIGYEANYMVVIDPERSTTPQKDKNFLPFKQAYTTFVLSLLSGFKIFECMERTKRQIRDLIREYGVRGIKDKYGDASLIRFALYWNLFFFKAHGKLEATL